MCYLVGLLFGKYVSHRYLSSDPSETAALTDYATIWYWLAKSAVDVSLHIVWQLGSLHEELWDCCRYTDEKATGINRAPHSRLSHFCHQVRAVLLQLPAAREGRDRPVAFAECQCSSTNSRTFNKKLFIDTPQRQVPTGICWTDIYHSWILATWKELYTCTYIGHLSLPHGQGCARFSTKLKSRFSFVPTAQLYGVFMGQI
jgi:hypothetical protein